MKSALAKLRNRASSNPSKHDLFPQELLIEIMTYAVSSARGKAIKRRRGTLSLVCRLWKDLVISTPSLWTNLYIGDDGCFSSQIDQMVDEAVAKAGDFGIHLEIAFTWVTSFAGLGDALRRHASKWVQITLARYDPSFLFEASGVQSQSNRQPLVWPNLHTLVLISTTNLNRMQDEFMPTVWKLGNMPKLTSLVMKGKVDDDYFSSLPLDQLKQVEVEGLTDARRFIQTVAYHCSALEELIIPGVRLRAESTLRNLTSLRIEGRSTLTIFATLQSIDFPRLESLDINFGDCNLLEDRLAANILRVGVDSQCADTLSTLVLSARSGRLGPSNAIFDLLKSLPNLRRLCLSDDLKDFDFLSRCNREKVVPLLATILVNTSAIPPVTMQSVFYTFIKERGYGTGDGDFSTGDWSERICAAELKTTPSIPFEWKPPSKLQGRYDPVPRPLFM